jgi:hypothetical protein
MLDDTGSYWAASGQAASIFADFGAPVALSSVDLLPVAAAPSEAPRTGTIVFSDDGINYTPVTSYDAGVFSSGTAKKIVIPTTTKVNNVGTTGISVQSVVSAATLLPGFSNDLVKVTAQAAALLVDNWTGTPAEGHGLVIRIKDNGTARAITYGTKYRAVGVTLPTTTVVGKELYLAVIYNETADKFDVIAIRQEA